jgi:hypothetical protein
MDCNLSFLERDVLSSMESTIHFLQSKNVINPSWNCSRCDRQGSLIKDRTCTDGCIWRCPKCMHKRSLRHESWFAKSNLSLVAITRLVYYWVQETEEQRTKFECGIGSDNTMVDFFMYCRQVSHFCVSLIL